MIDSVDQNIGKLLKVWSWLLWTCVSVRTMGVKSQPTPRQRLAEVNHRRPLIFDVGMLESPIYGLFAVPA